MDAAVQDPTLSSPPLSGTAWTIAADGHEAVVVEVGGGLREYRHDGVDYVDGYGSDEVAPAAAGQILAPWPNRVRDGRYTFNGEKYQLALTEPVKHNAIHGLVNWARWSLVSAEPHAVTLEHDLVPVPGYPFPLRLRTTWSVGADGLTASHEATNTGAVPAPFGLASHPYFLVPDTSVDQVTMTVPGGSRVLLDGRLLPIGTARVAGTDFDYTGGRQIGGTILDVSFGEISHDEHGRSAVTLRGPSGSGVVCWADGAFRYWQVFTGDTLSPPRRRRAVAVEPMTCPADALRSGRDLVVLEPGQTWRGSWGAHPLAG